MWLLERLSMENLGRMVYAFGGGGWFAADEVKKDQEADVADSDSP